MKNIKNEKKYFSKLLNIEETLEFISNLEKNNYFEIKIKIKEYEIYIEKVSLNKNDYKYMISLFDTFEIKKEYTKSFLIIYNKLNELLNKIIDYDISKNHIIIINGNFIK